jgi:transcriptional regulator with XRE-family HTH domain
MNAKQTRSDFLRRFGRRLCDLRRERLIYQETFAERIGMTQSAYSRLENGQVDISVRRAAQIADAFGVSLNELLRGLL